MPTYEFRCPDGRIIERIFKISEVPDAIPTPDGNGMATRIISGGAGLLFKGSGFYITDYGKDGKKDQRASTSTAGGSSGASEGGASTGGTSGSGASGGGTSASGESKSTTTPAKSE
jgi:predicted nucleic acid-binding Zn ribbon protein